jgi:hypothetical protein
MTTTTPTMMMVMVMMVVVTTSLYNYYYPINYLPMSHTILLNSRAQKEDTENFGSPKKVIVTVF